ncbi:MAG: cytochrome P450, partial [Lachnospiraceae bacterium]|nr:cytochrome P450 [Lachnospiraceae bacterium]
ADDIMDTSGAQCWYDNGAIKFSVWNPADMSEPIQIVCKYVETYHYQGSPLQYKVLDANFDGYTDFAWICHSGNQPIFYYLWLWDEEQKRFVEEPAYHDISSPVADADKEIIYGWSRSSAASDGCSTLHKWIDGHLLCVRHIEVWREIHADNYTMTVEDWVDGEMIEIYRAEFPSPEEFDPERSKWLDPDYHGEQ